MDSFNETVALPADNVGRRISPRLAGQRGDLQLDTAGFMRPRPNTTVNGLSADLYPVFQHASVRLWLNTTVNRCASCRQSFGNKCFNEAVAQHHGKPDFGPRAPTNGRIASMKPRLRRGYTSDTKRPLNNTASMRPWRLITENDHDTLAIHWTNSTSMRSCCIATENRDASRIRRRRCLASMRPRRFTADNAGSRESVTRHYVAASMRPQHFTADNAGSRESVTRHYVAASMRPQHFTADNGPHREPTKNKGFPSLVRDLGIKYVSRTHLEGPSQGQQDLTA